MISRSTRLSRLNGVLGLFIGLFGAMAILGVFFKIAKYPHWEILMAVGFIGEAAAFIVMGIFALIAGFLTNGHQEAPSPSAQAPANGLTAEALAAEAADEFRLELRTAMQAFGDRLQRYMSESLTRDFETAMEGVSTQAFMACEEMRHLGDSLGSARGAVDSMRQALEATASGQLAADAEALGSGMRQIARSMEDAGEAVEEVHREVAAMAHRFRAFNWAGQVNRKPAELPGMSVAAGV